MNISVTETALNPLHYSPFLLVNSHSPIGFSCTTNGMGVLEVIVNCTLTCGSLFAGLASGWGGGGQGCLEKRHVLTGKKANTGKKSTRSRGNIGRKRGGK